MNYPFGIEILPFNHGDTWGHSVYVISDKQLEKYKQDQLKSEIYELEKLIEGHKESIEKLESLVDGLRSELPKTSMVEEKQLE